MCEDAVAQRLTRWTPGQNYLVPVETKPSCCVVFLGKRLYSHSASLYPGVWMGTGLLSGKADEMQGVTLRWTSIPSRGGVVILLVASCCRNWDKLRLGESLGSSTDLHNVFYIWIRLALFYRYSACALVKTWESRRWKDCSSLPNLSQWMFYRSLMSGMYDCHIST